MSVSQERKKWETKRLRDDGAALDVDVVAGVEGTDGRCDEDLAEVFERGAEELLSPHI